MVLSADIKKEEPTELHNSLSRPSFGLSTVRDFPRQETTEIPVLHNNFLSPPNIESEPTLSNSPAADDFFKRYYKAF